MNKISKVILGLSLLTSTAIFASGEHTGNHMHEGKMQNHMNEAGMNDHEMKKMMKHDSSMKAYHNVMHTNGYAVMLNSKKPLTDGKHMMYVNLSKNGQKVKDAKVSLNFSMPSMPGMSFTRKATLHDDMYMSKINFSMGGEWAYKVMFKTTDGKKYETKGMVNLK
jgi:hypothetical protein